jgi:hypothetical protein
MIQQNILSLPDDNETLNQIEYPLSKGYVLIVNSKKNLCLLNHRGRLIKSVKSNDKIAMKIFIIEIAELGVYATPNPPLNAAM